MSVADRADTGVGAATAPPAAGRRSGRLPDFPWDVLAPYKERAARHPDGLVDLSIGTPVDPTPEPVMAALRAAADSPGYPSVAGTARLRSSIREYLQRRCGAPPLTDASILPTIGSKELVASLPSLLDLGPDQVVLVPALAYPTYAVGALLSGAQVVASDATLSAGPAPIGLVWVNSPANPHGRVLPVDHLRKVVSWARERGAVVASDECYFEFGWDADPVSVLDPRVNGGTLDGVLALHSLSKRSNLAGYRAAFVAGDPALVAELYAVRRHAGLMLPGPVQAAMSVALDDDEHVQRQRGRYLARRTALRTAFERAGFRIDHSEGSLYLWATRDEPCWHSVGWLSERGILVTPGELYGRTGGRHVRVALTVADSGVATVAERLA